MWTSSKRRSVPDDQLLALNDALDRFAALEPQQAELVKLRYFVGMKIEEAAEVSRHLKSHGHTLVGHARAWLFTEIAHRKDVKTGVRAR